MARADTYEVRVTVDGRALGVFDGFQGGGMDSEETRHRAGGMQPEVSLGGPQTQTEITVMRLESEDRDDFALQNWLMQKVGTGRVVITRTPLKRDGSVAGRARTHRGMLKSVTPPDHDSNSADAATYSLTITPEGVPA